jgi:hypothetical protein
MSNEFIAKVMTENSIDKPLLKIPCNSIEVTTNATVIHGIKDGSGIGYDTPIASIPSEYIVELFPLRKYPIGIVANRADDVHKYAHDNGLTRKEYVVLTNPCRFKSAMFSSIVVLDGEYNPIMTEMIDFAKATQIIR